MQFVDLDGDYHVLAEGGVKTACYLDVPYGSPWVIDPPKDLCDECAEKTGLKPAKKARSDKA